MNEFRCELREGAYTSGWKGGVPSLRNPCEHRAKPFSHDRLHGFQRYVARSHTVLVAYDVILKIGLSIIQFAMRYHEPTGNGYFENLIDEETIEISGDGPS